METMLGITWSYANHNNTKPCLCRSCVSSSLGGNSRPLSCVLSKRAKLRHIPKHCWISRVVFLIAKKIIRLPTFSN